MFPWVYVDGFCASKSEGVGLKLSVQLVSNISNLCGPDPPTLQTDSRTDGRTDDMQSQYRALDNSASLGENHKKVIIADRLNRSIEKIEKKSIDLIKPNKKYISFN